MMAGSALPSFVPDNPFYAYVARGFDLISPSYDEVEARNAVGRRARRLMQEALFRTFHEGQRVLEIGCGTGIEAIALAERGVEVLAADVSPEMVQRTQEKADARGLPITARVLAARDVGTLVDEFGAGSFDGAYSHGGVLNMEPALAHAATGVADLLRSGGRFLGTVVNQSSLFEILFYPLVFRPRKAFRRLGNTIPIPITRLKEHSRYVVPSRFYSPHAFLEVFGGRFRLRNLRGIEILLPLWSLSDYVDRYEAWARAAEVVEDHIAGTAPFNSWGSLFLIDLDRVA